MDFQDKFIAEAQELIYGLESQLISLESNTQDKVAINEIFRVMHTLKGAASMFGFDKIEQITHHLESIYDSIRDNEIEVTPEIINLTFSTIDIIKIILEKRNELNKTEQKNFDEILQKINHFMGDILDEKDEQPSPEYKQPTQQPLKAFYISYTPDENIYFRGIKPLSVFFELTDLGKYKAIPYTNKTPSPQNFNPDKFFLYWDIFFLTECNKEDVEDIFLFFRDEEYYINELNIDRLDKSDFIKTYTEKTGRKLTNNEIKGFFIDLDKSKSLKIEKPEYIGQKNEKSEKETKLKDIERKTVDLFKKTSTIRVSADKLDDLITNVSEFVTLYSQISLYSRFIENKELNKSIQALGKLSKKLRDNALELRLVEVNELAVKLHRLIRDLSYQLGKEINFITEGTDTELDKTIIDNLEEPLMHIIRNSIDHGIENKETRLKMNKPEKGIVRLTSFYSGANVFIQIQDDGKGVDLDAIKQKAIAKGLINENLQLTSREIYDLLFLPGFSTAENISKISGRGVGMDVVKQKITELRGEIEIDSEIDLGTSVTIKLPLTLSIIDTMKVKIANLLYLVPLSSVETCIRVNYQEIAKSIKNQFEYEGNLLPVVQLRKEFNILNNTPIDGRIIIVKQYEKKYCILVDEVLGDHQAVVKPLGDLHKRHNYFSGASIMGDGSLALILDTGKIYTMNKKNQNIT